MAKDKTLRTCKEGHKYYKASDCPTCPICEAEKIPKEGFLSLVSAPARRALETRNITNVQKLSTYTEAELLNLHGVGPGSIPRLRSALQKEGLDFKKL